MGKSYLGLITRCKDEYFVQEFCEYYLKQGVDKILIFDDDSVDKSIYTGLFSNPRVEIFYEKNITKKDCLINRTNDLRERFEWVIYVDVDEFITTKNNLNNTIRDELSTTFKDAHVVKVPWVMMACNGLEKNPDSILDSITYRWNHDNKHVHAKPKFRCRYEQIEVKTIFKPEFFKYVSSIAGGDHTPHGHMGDSSLIREGVYNSVVELNPFYDNLREEHIKNGYLLCYHYRMISKENCINKLKTNRWYRETKVTLKHMLDFDHPEVLDTRLKN